MRFKALVLCISACCFYAQPGVAQEVSATLMQPQELTQSFFENNISVSSDPSLNFAKNPRMELFKTLQANGQTIGYSQAYLNPLCFAAISYFYPNLGRLSNAKIKRYLKDTTAFQITHQNSTHLDDLRLHYMAGAQKDQTDLLMATALKDNILQIRMTCQTQSNLSEKENRKNAVFWSKEMTRRIIENLKK